MLLINWSNEIFLRSSESNFYLLVCSLRLLYIHLPKLEKQASLSRLFFLLG